jgi:hypothetical protein
MSSAAFQLLLVLGLAYAAFAVPVMLRFYSYCEQVAKATGRSNENQEVWQSDESGNNKFQREQLRRLRTGEYKLLSDPELVKQGETLARHLRLTFWLAVGLVLTVAAADLWLR